MGEHVTDLFVGEHFNFKRFRHVLQGRGFSEILVQLFSQLVFVKIYLYAK